MFGISRSEKNINLSARSIENAEKGRLRNLTNDLRIEHGMSRDDAHETALDIIDEVESENEETKNWSWF